MSALPTFNGSKIGRLRRTSGLATAARYSGGGMNGSFGPIRANYT